MTRAILRDLLIESPDCKQTFKQFKCTFEVACIEIHICKKPFACPDCDKKFTLVKSRSSVMIVTRRLNNVMARFTLHDSGKPFASSDCKNARLQGNKKIAFSMPSCFVSLYRDTAVFLVVNLKVILWGVSTPQRPKNCDNSKTTADKNLKFFDFYYMTVL